MSLHQSVADLIHIESRVCVFSVEIGSEEKKNKKVDDAFRDADIDERDPDDEKEKNRMAANGGDSSDDEVLGDDDDATAVKLKSKVHDEQEYDEAAVEEERKDASDVESDDDDMDIENVANDEENGTAAEKEDVIVGLDSNEFSQQYRTDKENHLWCELTFDLDMTYKNVDLSIVLKEVARKSVIVEVPQIRRAITYNRDDDIFLKTDGINISEMFKYMEMLDLNRLYTNQIHAMARTYGIEAAARVVVKVSDRNTADMRINRFSHRVLSLSFSAIGSGNGFPSLWHHSGSTAFAADR